MVDGDVDWGNEYLPDPPDRCPDTGRMIGLPWEESVEDEVDVVDEDWLAGVSCNPDAPEECESCQ